MADTPKLAISPMGYRLLTGRSLFDKLLSAQGQGGPEAVENALSALSTFELHCICLERVLGAPNGPTSLTGDTWIRS